MLRLKSDRFQDQEIEGPLGELHSIWGHLLTLSLRHEQNIKSLVEVQGKGAVQLSVLPTGFVEYAAFFEPILHGLYAIPLSLDIGRTTTENPPRAPPRPRRNSASNCRDPSATH